MSRPRQPGRSTKGTRDRLVSELQAKGYKYEVARRAVEEVFDLMKQALARRETVEIPGLGWLAVVPAKKRRCWRLGRIVDIPRHPFQIKLLKEHPGPRRRRRPGPEKTASPKPSLLSHPPLIAVQPHQNRYDVPSRTRGIKPGKR